MAASSSGLRATTRRPSGPGQHVGRDRTGLRATGRAVGDVIAPPAHVRTVVAGRQDAAAVLPGGDIDRVQLPVTREQVLHFSEASLAALKKRARGELLAAGDPTGAAALTRFQALTSLIWRSITRTRRLPPEQNTVCRTAVNNRGRLRPPLPPEYFGNSIHAAATSSARAADLLSAGHGRAAAAVAAHADAAIRARVATWAVAPVVYSPRMRHGGGLAAVRREQVRLRVGEGGGGAEREGGQVRREGVHVPGPGQRH